MAKKTQRQQILGKVILPTNNPNPPEEHEIDVAYILAKYYRTAVEFILPIYDYKRKSADIMMNGVAWEIKSPRGNGKSTISNQLRNASKQSSNIIIDSRLTKMKDEDVEKRVRFSIQNKSSIKKVILVTKAEKVVEVR